MNGVRIYVSNDIESKDIILNGEPLDLFDDETIQITLKQSDFKEISTNFADYTQAFNVPASPQNNRIFKYWFDIYNDDQLSSVDGIPARIDIDGVLFKMGTIKIQNFQTDENGSPKSYSINFTSNLKSLKDQFGETLIGGMSFSSTLGADAVFQYSDSTVISQIQNNSNGNIEFPMVSTTRLLDNYDNLKYTGSNTSGIRKEELRPALKVKSIFNAIEDNYGLKFGGNFFTTNSPLDKLYMWCNKNEEPYTNGGVTMDFNGLTIRMLLSPMTPPFGEPPTNYDTGTASVWINTNNNIIRLKKSYITFGSGLSLYSLKSTHFKFSLKTFTNNNITQYRFYLQEVKMMSDGVTVNEAATSAQTNEGYVWNSNWVTGNQSTDYYLWVCSGEPNNKERFFRWRIEAKGSITFNNTQISVQHTYSMNNVFFSGPVNPEGYYSTQHILMSNATNTILGYFDVRKNLPDITINDFMTSIIKMFNLVIVPVFEPQIQALFPDRKIFLLETFNKYYGGINEIDITKYVKPSKKLNKIKTFKKFEFKHLDSKYGTNINFKKVQLPEPREYGSVKSEFKEGDEGEMKVETKFGLMIWREMPNVGITASEYSMKNTWVIADALNEDYSKPVYNTPTIFYYNGKSQLNNRSLSFVNESNSTQNISKYSIFSNLYDIDDLNSSAITFSTENMFGLVREKSLFYNYYKKLINGVYSPYSREYEVEAVLPKQIYRNLSLGSQIIISQDRYTITDININLINGITKLKLNNIVEEGDILETIVDTPPLAPTAFVAIPDSNEIELQWSGTYDDYGIQGYIIDSAYLGGSYSYLTTVTSSAFNGSYSHMGLTSGATYSYRLRVLDVVGNTSSYVYTSAATGDDIPPLKPSTMIVLPHPTSVQLFWSGASDNVGIRGYEFQFKTSSYATWSAPIFITTSNTGNNYTQTGLNVVTGYDFRVRTKDTYNNWSIDYKTASTTTLTGFAYLRSIDSQSEFATDICDVSLPTEAIYSNKYLYEIGIGDKFYNDATLTTPFDGGGEYWRICSADDYLADSYYIESDGSVGGISTCQPFVFDYFRSSNGLSQTAPHGQIGSYIEDGCYDLFVGTTKLYTRKPIHLFDYVSDKIYTNSTATTQFNGGNKIWKISDGFEEYSLIIKPNGLVTEVFQCY